MLFPFLGQIVSFKRSCEKDPLVLNGIRQDAHYTKFYSSCKVDLCNSGDGLSGTFHKVQTKHTIQNSAVVFTLSSIEFRIRGRRRKWPKWCNNCTRGIGQFKFKCC